MNLVKRHVDKSLRLPYHAENDNDAIAYLTNEYW